MTAICTPTGKTLAAPNTLVDLLRLRAQQTPDKVVFTFLTSGESEELRLTFADLDARARAIAATLQEQDIAGERVLLLYPPGLDYIAAFFGCLYAGAVAIPSYPPRPNRPATVLQAILESATPVAALSTRTLLASRERWCSRTADLKDLRWMAGEDFDLTRADEWKPPALSRDSLAFLQYTSGSTSTPRGVMVSHGNLLHNAGITQSKFRTNSSTTAVSWLPLYHDMGLIGAMLGTVYCGGTSVLMAPLAFVQRPRRWLEAITHYRANVSGGPNSAYDLCVRRIPPEQREGLDLSSWELAFNGAEPVRSDTLDRFTEAFAPYGFRREAFYPCFGLAEATLHVSGSETHEAPTIVAVNEEALALGRVLPGARGEPGCRTLVSCGHSAADQTIAIVDPETRLLLPEGYVGEIWVSGPSVAQGYWRRPEATAETFQAHLADSGEGPFLRTGDLGFLQDGELYVTGRRKDVIIIRGRNYYPQDIEWTVQHSHPRLRQDCTAAFAIEVRGEERLVVVQEVERRDKELRPEEAIEAIRQAVSEQHDLGVYAVVLISSVTIPRTSSGKIQRYACRQMFIEESLEIVARSVADLGPGDATLPFPGAHTNGQTLASPRELLLATHPQDRLPLLQIHFQVTIARILNVHPLRVDPAQPLNRLGLDSIQAIEIQTGLERALGVALPMDRFLEGPSLSDLASEVLARMIEPEFPVGAASRAAPDGPARLAGPTPDAPGDSPLSPGQQALWFLHQMAPDSAAYNIAAAVRIRDHVNLPVLREVFQALVLRHPALRTTFPAHDGKPVQRVHKHAEVFFRVEDVSGLSDEEIRQRLGEEANRPFDLEKGPLFRVHAFSRSARDHFLLLAIHHTIADFWSLTILVHELGILYAARSGDRAAALPVLTHRYTDHVRRQAAMLDGPEGERHWQYWQQQLAGELPVLSLPTDRPRPPVQTYQGSTQTLHLDAELSRKLKVLAEAHGATLYSTLLAAFQVLLSRYTGQEDVIVGSPAAGRGRAEVSDVVGYFVNTLPLRANLAGNPRFVDHLERVRQTVVASLRHQDYPFPLLVDKLQPVRDPSRSPIFQVMFVLQRAHRLHDQGITPFALREEGARMQLGGLTLESTSFDQRMAQFDLTLIMADTPAGLAASVEYNTDLFDASTMVRLLGHLQTLLEGIVADPARRVAELPLLPDAERRLLHDWNQTATPYDLDVSLHSLIERQVERAPDQIAVIFGDSSLTYRQLNRRANRLAHYLRARGVGPETLVGVCMERSPEMVVALLGVLKAGAAYVPLDPEYPRDRLAFMLSDARVPVLLSQRRLLENLPEHTADTLCLDDADELLSSQPSDNPTSGVLPDNLAYVIYTSGSTGRPKGAMNTHRAIVNRLLWMQDAYGLTSADRVLQKTPFSFDVSVWEFFWPLMTGATLVVARPGGHRDSSYLIDLINGERITVLHFVPSMLQVFLAEKEVESCVSLRKVICSGEALSWELQERFFARLAEAELHNLYGPTEAAVDVTYWACQRGRKQRIVPIGRPIANIQMHVLDPLMQPVPVGVPGELHIGGVGLARGYLNRPGLTAEKFVADPLGERPGRLYKTGDLARWREDGTIEYFGRLDFQVKIRGLRIELEEIEAILAQHPTVRETIVLARQDEPGHARLVAYVVPNHNLPLNIPELRAHLKERLPDYMVPAHFVVLEALPLNPNGKVDRRALPAPERDRGGVDKPLVLPRSPAEHVLADIWRQVLGVPQVGIDDNFFELGGDSILSIQIIARANQAGLRLNPRDLFQHQTIAALAAVAETDAAPTAEQGLVTGPVPLTPIQHWFFEQRLTVPFHFNQALLLEVHQRLDPALLEPAVRRLLEHHDALRLRFVRKAGDWHQLSRGVEEVLPCLYLDLSREGPEEQQRAIKAVAFHLQQCMDLSEGPLMWVVLFGMGPNQPGRLLVIVHHLAMDAVSFPILLQDLMSVYQQLAGGKSVQLPPKTTSFQRWAQLLQEEASSPTLLNELDYWLSEQRAEVPPLPVDFPGGGNTWDSARVVEVFLGPAETEALLREVPNLYHAEVQSVLLAALAEAFGNWSQRELLVDVEGHGRDVSVADVDLSRTVGWFTSLYPALLQRGRSPGAVETLERVKRLLGRMPRGGRNYGLLRYLSPDPEPGARLGMMPQAEVLFNYLGQLDRALPTSAALTLARESAGSGHSPLNRRSHLFEVIARVVGGQLRVSWMYSENLHRRETVEGLAGAFLEALQTLVAERHSRDPGEMDNGLFELEDEVLKEVGAQLGLIDREGTLA